MLYLEKKFRVGVMLQLQANMVANRKIDDDLVKSWFTTDHEEAMRICRRFLDEMTDTPEDDDT
jgi:hypothetical protein